MMASSPSHTRGIVYTNAQRMPFPADFSRLPRRSAFQTMSQRVLVESLRTNYRKQMRKGNLFGPGEGILKSAREARMDLQALVEGKNFMDLGCGRERMLSTIAFAKSLGAKNYIGIDVCFPDDASTFLSQLGPIASNIGILLIESNMLDFLQLVPASSPVAAMMNLITGDKELYFQDGISCNVFCSAVAGELTRIVQPNGLAFGTSSDALSALPAKSWLSRKEGSTTFAIRRQ